MKRAKLQKLKTDEIVEVHSTTVSHPSSCAQEVWVDDEGNIYGTVNFMPFGYAILEYHEDE